MFNKFLLVFGIIFILIIGLGNSGLHPTSGTAGYTGAPGDSNCGQCHSGGNASLDGNITLSGLPATIITGQSYTIGITITNPNGNAVKAGFQMLVLTGTNTNAGTLSEHPDYINTTEILTVFGGKKYIGHNPALDFPANNELTYFVNWTAPATTGSNPIIKFYASAVIANGADGSDNDRISLTNAQIPIQNPVSPVMVSITNVQSTLCAGSNNGSATASATGGTGNYTYLWNNGISSANNISLPAGLAIVTVTDNTGNSSTGSVNITAPPSLIVNTFGSVVCQGETNGVASSIVSGGTGSYFYSWSNGSVGGNISNLTAGNYTVTVSDSNGCSKTATASVTTSPDILISSNITNVRCNGQSNGNITTLVSSGIPPYTYLWSNGNTQDNITNLPSNTYSLTVTDAALCTKSAMYIVNQPPPLTAQITNQTNVSCFGQHNGSATISASGGSPSYSFFWSNGTSGNGLSNTQNFLGAGNYTVTITDFYDCNTSINVIITEPEFMSITADQLNNVTCFESNNGSIHVAVTGSTGNISYLWSNMGANAGISGLSPGNYTVTVTNGLNSCTQTATYNITQPPILTVVPNNVGNVTCNGGNNGTVFALVSGGNGNYSYKWSNNTNTNILNNISAGSYTVTVTDIKGCTASASVTLAQPPPIDIQLISNSNATCPGASNGSISVMAANGISPYQYLWSNGNTLSLNNNLAPGNYTITVTDHNNCTNTGVFAVEANVSFELEILNVTNINCYGDSTGMVSVTENNQFIYLWSNGETGSMLENVAAGTYFVVATDQAGCQSTPTQVIIFQSLPLEATILSADTILCPGDSNGYLFVTLSGGNGELTYQWSNGELSLLADSLAAGVYTITVTDSLQCNTVTSFEIIKADSINIDQTVKDVICYDGSSGEIILTIDGGFGELNNNWSNGASDQDTLSGLTADDYFITITDEANCIVIDTFTVQQPDSLYVSLLVQNESEAGLNDGMITLVPLGGVAPYFVSWDHGSDLFILNNLGPGIYNYTLSDSNGCTITGWAVVGGGNCQLSATVDITPPTCFNSFDGALVLNISGQFAPYNIRIFNESAEIFYPLDSLPGGNFTLIISDSLQCLAILQNLIVESQHTPIILDTVIVENPTSSINTNGSLEAIVSGGEGELSYEWIKNGLLVGTTSKISHQSVGIYTLYISDTLGCTLRVTSIFLQAVNSNNDYVRSNIKLFPNPVDSDMKISTTSGIPISKIEIFDIYGKKVFTDIPAKNSYSAMYDLNEKNILPGFYLACITLNGIKVNKKFIYRP